MSEIGTPGWMGRLRSLRCRFVVIGLHGSEVAEMLRMGRELREFEAANARPTPPGWKRAGDHNPRDGQRVLVKLPECREMVMDWDAALCAAIDPDNRARSVETTAMMWLDYPSPPEFAGAWPGRADAGGVVGGHERA